DVGASQRRPHGPLVAQDHARVHLDLTVPLQHVDVLLVPAVPDQLDAVQIKPVVGARLGFDRRRRLVGQPPGLRVVLLAHAVARTTKAANSVPVEIGTPAECPTAVGSAVAAIGMLTEPPAYVPLATAG